MSEAGMVIVGGGMAGARAIVSLRANGFQGPITLVSEETLLPYDRPPLSKAMLVDENEPQPVLLLDDGMIASLNAIFVRGAKAIGIDRRQKALVLEDGRAIAYDKLLIATGAKPRRLSIEGASSPIRYATSPMATTCATGCARAHPPPSSAAASSGSRWPRARASSASP